MICIALVWFGFFGCQLQSAGKEERMKEECRKGERERVEPGRQQVEPLPILHARLFFSSSPDIVLNIAQARPRRFPMPFVLWPCLVGCALHCGETARINR